MKSAGNGGILKGHLQVLHVHVLLVAPLGARHVAQPCADQHQSGIAVREAANHTGAAADLPVRPLNHIIGTDASPVLTGKIAVSQCFFNAVLHLLGGLFQLHGTQLLHYGFGLLTGGFLALLGVDRLEHLGYQLHLRARCYGEHIAVKVDGTPLVFGFRKHFSHSLQHTKALVSNDESYPIQTTTTEPLKEIDPTGLIFFHALGCTKNLTITILVDRNGYQNGYVFKLPAPVAAQIDPIYVDIRIPPALQRTVPPILDVDIRFLIQLADGRWRHLAAPQGLGDVLHTPDRHAGQVHLNEGLFHTAFTTAIPLNDGSLKGDALELGHLEGDIPGSGGEITVVVAAAVALALLVALVPGRLRQLLCLGLQQLVEGFLYAASHQLLELALDNFLV